MRGDGEMFVVVAVRESGVEGGIVGETERDTVRGMVALVGWRRRRRMERRVWMGGVVGFILVMFEDGGWLQVVDVVSLIQRGIFWIEVLGRGD